MQSIRRRRLVDNDSFEEKDVEYSEFVAKYQKGTTLLNVSSRSSRLGAFIFLFLFGSLGCLYVFLQNGGSFSIFMRVRRDDSKMIEDARNLKLITVYPYSVSSRVRDVKGHSQLLVTPDKLDVIDAVRKSIGMSNNLKHKKSRKRNKSGVVGILLGLVHLLGSLGSSNEYAQQSGEILLESFDLFEIRNYFIEKGQSCYDSDEMKSSENHILQQYDKLIATLNYNEKQNDMTDALWSKVVNLFVWCQFANADSMGYITHGMTINFAVASTSLHDILDDARLYGTGVRVLNSHAIEKTNLNEPEWMQHSPLFVIPAGKDNEAVQTSKEMARKMLLATVRAISNERSSLFKFSLLSLDENEISKWTLKQQFIGNRTQSFRSSQWISLKSVVTQQIFTSDSRWLAQYCPMYGRNNTQVNGECILIFADDVSNIK